MIVQPSFPILFTDRLVLRELQESDDEAIFSLRSNEEVNMYIGRPRQTNIDEARAFILKIKNANARHESFYWAVALKEEPVLVGTICIYNISADRKTGEIGYELSPGYQGKGIMNEAIGRVIDFAFQEAGFTNLEAYTHKANTKSTKLLSRHHFSLAPEKKDPDNADIIILILSRDVHT